MTKEIVLPIKCSTVKRARSHLDLIIYCEMILLSLIVTAMYGEVFWYAYPSNIGYAMIVIPAVVVDFVVCMVICGVIYDYLPSLGCIKDEETP